MPKTIIFDLGGVLIDWNPKYMYRKIFNDESEIDWFLNNICTFEWNEEQDGGRTIAQANQILISKYPEHTQHILAYYERWPEMLGGEIKETVDLLRRLKESEQYRLLALTNWSAETFPIAQKRFDFLSWFEGILVSGEENLKKPDPKIYKLLIDRFELDPSDCLFIDDNLRNVNAAIASGIPTIHFQSANQLSGELNSREVIF